MAFKLDLGSLVGTIGGSLTGGGLSSVMLIAKLLAPGTDWKRVLQTEGEKILREKVIQIWVKHLNSRTTKIVGAMTGEGWSLEKAMDPAFQKTQKIDAGAVKKATELGPLKGGAWLISRDALYSQLRESKIPGGEPRDAWRDAADDKVFAAIEPQIVTGVTLADIVTMNATALPHHTL